MSVRPKRLGSVDGTGDLWMESWRWRKRRRRRRPGKQLLACRMSDRYVPKLNYIPSCPFCV